MSRQDLGALLRATLASRRIDDLRQFFEAHGLVAFSVAVAECRPRVAADALSLLLPAQRSAVLRHLPNRLRHQLAEARMSVAPATTLREPSTGVAA